MKVVVNGQMINYTDEGEGNVILFLHGWGANLNSFSGMSDELAGRYRIVRLDFPGFGESPQPGQDWSLINFAELVVAFLDKIGVTNLYAVIAHSFGGRVVIKMTGLGYLDPEKIILMDSGGIRHNNTLRNRAFQIIAKSGKQLTKLPILNRSQSLLRRKLYESAGSTDYIEAGGMQKIFLNIIDEDVRELAASISQPSLLIWGSGDMDTPISDAKIFHNQIQGSSLIIISDAGHFVFLDQPKRVMHEIKEFLQ